MHPLPPRPWLGSLTLLCTLAAVGAEPGSGVQIRQLPDRLRIEISGQLFSEYRYQGASRSYLYPVLAPGGIHLSRRWPLEEGTGEDKDHPHHKSFWYAHGDVNGHDFWSESDKAGKTVHQKFLEIQSGPETGVIRSANQLVAKDGTIVATDERTLRFYNRADARVWDFEITIHASHGEVRLGDTKEGTMAIRLAETMRLKPNKFNAGKPTGHILNSEGVRDGSTWGKRAKWVDYWGPVDGQTWGIAIFDHPQNPQHPTWWHVRDYGLFAANPFGVHDFEKKPPGAGTVTIPAGKSLTYRYRFYAHRGDAQEAKVEAEYQRYAASKSLP